MYLDRKTLPDENELFDVYKTIAQKMNGKPVIIRTLDIGADKQAVSYTHLDVYKRQAFSSAIVFSPCLFNLHVSEVFFFSV